MSLVYETLQKMVGLTKPQRKFMGILLETIVGMLGRVNFANMSRQSPFHEKTFSRNFAKPFDYLMFNSIAIEQVYIPTKRYVLGYDQVFIPKTGKGTYGLGKFWNGSGGCAENGIEASGFALIDVESRISYPLYAAQTPPNDEIVALVNHPNATRMDYYTHIMHEQMLRLKAIYPAVKHIVVDAFFATNKFVEVITNANNHIVTKLRSNANLRSLEFEKLTGRGRPKKYGSKLDVKDDNDFKHMDEITIIINNRPRKVSLFVRDCYSMALKRNVRVVRIKYKGAITILCSTDFELSPQEIIEMYRSRFQIEFSFRDAKQYTGFTECQARSKQKIHHHLNASFSALLCTKIEDVKKQQNQNYKRPFSMASYKRQKHNEISINRIFSSYGFDPNLIKSHPGTKSLIEYGVIRY
jgi:hypothetical protein